MEIEENPRGKRILIEPLDDYCNMNIDWGKELLDNPFLKYLEESEELNLDIN